MRGKYRSAEEGSRSLDGMQSQLEMVCGMRVGEVMQLHHVSGDRMEVK